MRIPDDDGSDCALPQYTLLFYSILFRVHCCGTGHSLSTCTTDYKARQRKRASKRFGAKLTWHLSPRGTPAGRTGRPLTTCATRPCTLTQVLDADQAKYRRCGSQLTIEPAPRGWERAAGAVCAGPLGVSSKGHVFTQSAKGPPHIAMTALQPAAQRS